jgi:hypothetical protein
MDGKARSDERDRLRALLTQVRDDLNILLHHLEGDLLPTRMVGVSAHRHLTFALTDPALVSEIPIHHDASAGQVLGRASHQ